MAWSWRRNECLRGPCPSLSCSARTGGKGPFFGEKSKQYSKKARPRKAACPLPPKLRELLPAECGRKAQQSSGDPRPFTAYLKQRLSGNANQLCASRCDGLRGPRPVSSVFPLHSPDDTTCPLFFPIPSCRFPTPPSHGFQSCCVCP